LIEDLVSCVGNVYSPRYLPVTLMGLIGVELKCPSIRFRLGAYLDRGDSETTSPLLKRCSSNSGNTVARADKLRGQEIPDRLPRVL
jgi:hypothetical protein